MDSKHTHTVAQTSHTYTKHTHTVAHTRTHTHTDTHQTHTRMPACSHTNIIKNSCTVQKIAYDSHRKQNK